MKASFIAAASATVLSNSVPIEATLPGWPLGSPSGQIDVRMFYDVTCPDSRDTHYIWKKMFDEPSPIEGKKYSDIIKMRVSPVVLPYHIHSF